MTGKIFKLEMRRAIRDRRTWITLLIGCIIALVHLFHNIIPYADAWTEMALNPKADNQYPYTVFGLWIGGGGQLESTLYYLILPLLAVLPFGLSFMEDRDNGYIKQMYTRAGRLCFLKAKSAAAFLTGGAIVVFPLLLNFLLCCIYLPVLRPQLLAGGFVDARVLFHSLYETYPIAYVAIYLGIDFAYAGLMAMLPFFLSYFTDRKFIVLLLPFIAHVFIYSVSMMTPWVNSVEYTPMFFLAPMYGCPSVWVLVIYGFILFMLGGILFWKTGRKEDVF